MQDNNQDTVRPFRQDDQNKRIPLTTILENVIGENSRVKFEKLQDKYLALLEKYMQLIERTNTNL